VRPRRRPFSALDSWLLNDILDFPRLESKKMSAKSIRSRLVDIIEGHTKRVALGPQAGSEMSDVRRIPPPRGSRRSGARPVIANLVGNAITFHRGARSWCRSLWETVRRTRAPSFPVSATGIAFQE